MTTAFVIDSSSLIDLARKNPRQKYPGVWKYIEQLAEASRLVAPREVRLEVERGDDELATWTKSRQKMFLDPDAQQTNLLEQILQRFPALIDLDRTGPFADPWVVALALSLNAKTPNKDEVVWSVVSEEFSKGPGSSKIPDICAAFGVESINLLGLFAMQVSRSES